MDRFLVLAAEADGKLAFARHQISGTVHVQPSPVGVPQNSLCGVMTPHEAQVLAERRYPVCGTPAPNGPLCIRCIRILARQYPGCTSDLTINTLSTPVH